ALDDPAHAGVVDMIVVAIEHDISVVTAALDAIAENRRRIDQSHVFLSLDRLAKPARGEYSAIFHVAATDRAAVIRRNAIFPGSDDAGGRIDVELRRGLDYEEPPDSASPQSTQGSPDRGPENPILRFRQARAYVPDVSVLPARMPFLVQPRSGVIPPGIENRVVDGYFPIDDVAHPALFAAMAGINFPSGRAHQVYSDQGYAAGLRLRNQRTVFPCRQFVERVVRRTRSRIARQQT